jgi:hypothetical protein
VEGPKLATNFLCSSLYVSYCRCDQIRKPVIIAMKRSKTNPFLDQFDPKNKIISSPQFSGKLNSIVRIEFLLFLTPTQF